ncbi:MAG: hypothetical protein AB7D00_12810 [Rhodospirillaceae bacterium]
MIDIIIPMPFGPLSVSAEEVSGLYVHKTINGPGWTITEPRTGLVIGREFPTPAAAAACAKKLTTFVDFSTVIKIRAQGNFPNNLQEIEETIQGYGGKIRASGPIFCPGGNAISKICAEAVAGMENSS